MEGELKMTLPGHKRSVLCLYSGHDMFVSGGADGCVRVWEVKKASSSDLNAYRRIRCISVSPRLGYIHMISYWTHMVYVWYDRSSKDKAGL